MNGDALSTGYVVRKTYLRLAAEKPGAPTVHALEELIDKANEVGDLENSFPARLAAARGHQQIPELSSEALEHVELSADADAEVHRLLLRRCRRAESARDVLAELLAVAEDELELDEDLLSEHRDGDPAKDLHLDIVEKKRDIVARLRSLSVEEPNG